MSKYTLAYYFLAYLYLFHHVLGVTYKIKVPLLGDTGGKMLYRNLANQNAAGSCPKASRNNEPYITKTTNVAVKHILTQNT